MRDLTVVTFYIDSVVSVITKKTLMGVFIVTLFRLLPNQFFFSIEFSSLRREVLASNQSGEFNESFMKEDEEGSNVRVEGGLVSIREVEKKKN